MELEIKKSVKIQAKTLKIMAKCSDLFAATLHDQDGEILKEYDGYVPTFMPGQHYGDYVILNIDIDTGQILNWKVPTAQSIQEFIEGSGE